MNAFDACSDETLLQMTMAGDEEAFTRLYRRLRGVVYRFARQMSGSSSVAEDVTQDVFLILLRKAELYDPRRGSLSTYLMRIARNEILRRLDRDRAHVTIAEEDASQDKDSDENLIVRSDPLGNLMRDEEIESVRQAVLGLPLHYREVVVLCELEEMSYGEAAESLGCAIGTVRSRLHRARALLKRRLRGDEADEQGAPRINQASCLG
ncbi:MAG TPA: RNA polymerase sigma factor [Blastocatellia bacterium]|jgi:RNA polymerase sigma-70 factor (ECF subfamily)|nr:RNA polymerase sigma factor [Blastocatellia bacterium]